MAGSARGIQAGVWPTGAWIGEALGEGEPNPFTTEFDEVGRHYQRKQRLLHECAGDVGLGDPDPPPWWTVPQHDGRIIIATAFGAPYPAWDDRTGSFWLAHDCRVWAGIETVAEVEALPIPDWSANPLVRENVQAWERARERLGPETAGRMSLDWTEWCWQHPAGEAYRFSVFPSFLDLGAFLMGADEFLLTLASDPELSQALMRKCFELSASYSDAMCELYGRPRTAWCSMGGDNSCLVSAAMYRRYAMAFDAMVTHKCGDVPACLHSCGASGHLFGVWAEYPDRDQIVVMQTRALLEGMDQLRKALPDTYIQLTVHQPQFDFERESPERVRELVWRLAEDTEFRDVSLTVIVSDLDERCKENLRALYEAVDEVNAHGG